MSVLYAVDAILAKPRIFSLSLKYFSTKNKNENCMSAPRVERGTRGMLVLITFSLLHHHGDSRR